MESTEHLEKLLYSLGIALPSDFDKHTLVETKPRKTLTEKLGGRPGGKLSEELFYEREEAHHTNHEEILMAKRNCQQDMDVLLAYGQDLDRLAGEGDEERLKAVLEEIVPEHEPTGRA